MAPTTSDSDEQVDVIDAWNARLGSVHRELLRAIADGDRAEVWRDTGARDMAHWCAIRLGISQWKARRYLAAAHALSELPRIDKFLAAGELGIDKAIELTRFADRATEAGLCRWAQQVSPGAVRARADREVRHDLDESREHERSRYLHWWFCEEGTRVGLEAELPAADGAVVVKAIERLAEQVPTTPENGRSDADARRADALVRLASAHLGADADPDRATVVVHAPLEALASRDRACEIEGGGLVHAETVRRLLCTARAQVVFEDRRGDVIGVSRMLREPPAWMIRQLRYRDRECRFPGCGARRFVQAHHVDWWHHGGRTELANLVLLCFFHHKLVHEHGWGLMREPDGTVRWIRPDGTRYQAGSGPPRDVAVA